MSVGKHMPDPAVSKPANAVYLDDIAEVPVSPSRASKPSGGTLPHPTPTEPVEADSVHPEGLPVDFGGVGIAASLKKARKRGWREGYAAGRADEYAQSRNCDPESPIPNTPNPYEGG